MRATKYAVLLAALISVAGCQGSGGAVSMRWRIIDLSTGGVYDPHDQGQPDGSCECPQAQCTQRPWTVERVRLIVLDAAGAEVFPDEPRLVFPCSAREATTPFFLPTGSFGLTLVAYDPSNPTADTRALSPPPTVRDILPASKINLDVVGIGVNGQTP